MSIAGVPVLAILTVAVRDRRRIALQPTIWGRSVLAIGQNRAPRGWRAWRSSRSGCATYVLCGALGGLDGALLAGYFRGRQRRHRQRISPGLDRRRRDRRHVGRGGKANIPGVWGGALFLVLLLTMLNTFGVSAGVRLLATGLIIVAVIAAAGGEKRPR